MQRHHAARVVTEPIAPDSEQGGVGRPALILASQCSSSGSLRRLPPGLPPGHAITSVAAQPEDISAGLPPLVDAAGSAVPPEAIGADDLALGYAIADDDTYAAAAPFHSPHRRTSPDKSVCTRCTRLTGLRGASRRRSLNCSAWAFSVSLGSNRRKDHLTRATVGRTPSDASQRLLTLPERRLTFPPFCLSPRYQDPPRMSPSPHACCVSLSTGARMLRHSCVVIRRSPLQPQLTNCS